MEIGEGVAKLVIIMEKGEKCDYKPKKTTWKAILKGDGGKLGENLGNKPNASCVAELSSTTYPSQAHHLIPNARLNPKAAGAQKNPPHPVYELLIKGDYLYDDTDYDINHKNNGKWMPYAHALNEWITGATKKADKKHNKALIFDVMNVTQIQLHQGSHSDKRFGMGETGYLTRVNQYLDKIEDNGLSHFDGEFKCDDCSDKEQKGLYPPRENTIRYFDEASKHIEEDINECNIFVSEVASKFHQDIGFVMENNT
ncbi:hypothetical protein MNBD_GAMMA17-1957 [hydrothermal vent metagenome]|uniref:Uncharacterized protein n=1 Tax=hydrothermal vent metagenome TaxID=652676 RepID=A0A3B0ZSD9_9ZZZZ